MEQRIGLLGCGTVGGGVIELMRRRKQRLQSLTGWEPVIARVLVRDVHKERTVFFAEDVLTDDPDAVLGDESIRIIIETIGGIEPARTFILTAIARGKHVITANKDLIALCGEEILAAADAAGVTVLYEAAVGGAIPLIRPLQESLTANAISDLKGIVNGTTNYILSQMTETGADFSDVLQEAQDLGYAESDPSSDVDGLDAARKLTILASIAFYTRVSLSDVEVTGIRKITARDIAYAHELGAVIKLLAVGTERDGALTLHVRPTLIPKSHPLAHVSGSYNALFVRGDAAGDLMFFGRGAGALPTASAVVGDAIEVLKAMRQPQNGGYAPHPRPHKPVDQQRAEAASHYIRLSANDQPGVFAKIAGIFGDHGVSMETVLQKRVAAHNAEIVIVTHDVHAKHLHAALRQLEAHPAVSTLHCIMPVERSAEA